MTTDEKSKQTPYLHAVEPQSHFISEEMTGVYLFTAFLNSLCYKTKKKNQVCFGKKNNIQTALTYSFKKKMNVP